MQDYNIRSAVPSDSNEILDLVTEYCEELQLLYNKTSLKNYIDIQLGKIPVYVAVKDDKVVAATSFMIMKDPFNNEAHIARKIAHFVAKDHRKKGVSEALLKTAEQSAKDYNATKFYFSSPRPVNEEYKAFETEYVKEL